MSPEFGAAAGLAPSRIRRNLGRVERALRFILGAGLIAFALARPTQAWAWVGLLPLLTALMAWCPAYALARRQCRPSC